MTMTQHTSRRQGAHAAAPAPDQAPAPSFDPDERAVQIAAAKLRLVTDRRLGKVTPEWVKVLAAEKPPRRHAS